jgi:RNA polymerase sigma-32 factor
MRKRATSRDTDPSLQRYLQRVARCRLLSADEEKRLALEYGHTRSPAIEARLVESCLRLVVTMASRHCPRPGLLLDLIQEGSLGLLQAVRRFDPTRGPRLAVYARHWIRAQIFAALVANWRVVRLVRSPAQRAVFFALRRERARLEKLGIVPDDARLARRFGVKPEHFAQLAQQVEGQELSLEAPTFGGDGEPLGELMPAADAGRPDVRLECAETEARVREEVERCLNEATARDRQILRGRWCTDVPATLEHLGQRTGLSRERVRQIEEGHRARLARALADVRG